VWVMIKIWRVLNCNLHDKRWISSRQWWEYYANWRQKIIRQTIIWMKSWGLSKIPGVTSAPKVQPIERVLWCDPKRDAGHQWYQVKGQDWKKIEAFALRLRKFLNRWRGQGQPCLQTVLLVSPYLLIDYRSWSNLHRYGIILMDVQEILQ